jgi:hypothetical protein
MNTKFRQFLRELTRASTAKRKIREIWDKNLVEGSWWLLLLPTEGHVIKVTLDTEALDQHVIWNMQPPRKGRRYSYYYAKPTTGTTFLACFGCKDFYFTPGSKRMTLMNSSKMLRSSLTHSMSAFTLLSPVKMWQCWILGSISLMDQWNMGKSSQNRPYVYAKMCSKYKLF